ncbi:hypothetical protein PoB_006095100 [Plakobranchus ocellatus]|uniref:Uncharacterized protein n=1 Tax=Plakobranchus ocellatus TaxID=259542 RepID=A0AAV4CRH4_9GAST|nr:hypothetical protein PoB_006095100 [Plakobranchus ocellatus]
MEPHSFQTGTLYSNYKAEATALEDTTSLVKNSPHTATSQIVFLTEAKSVLQALQKGNSPTPLEATHRYSRAVTKNCLTVDPWSLPKSRKTWVTEGANKLHEVLPNLGEDLSKRGEGIGRKRETVMCSRLRYNAQAMQLGMTSAEYAQSALGLQNPRTLENLAAILDQQDQKASCPCLFDEQTSCNIEEELEIETEDNPILKSLQENEAVT